MNLRKFHPDFGWDQVEQLAYKAEGSAPFKGVTRQVLFDNPTLSAQWRYFEVAAGGYSSLERHQHVHAVMVLRGSGQVLIGTCIHALAPYDLVQVEAMTWHQFRAAHDQALGFLCLVNRERDRPQLPTDDDLQQLRSNPDVAEFLRTDAEPAS